MTDLHLKNLGHQTPHVYVGADPGLLERVPNPAAHPARPAMSVTITGQEFTSVCPVTGGPDFGKLTITYVPDEWLVESKALKFYLESYRNEPIMHEAAIAKIANDLIRLLDPCEMTVVGTFQPRGGWAIYPRVEWVRD